MAPSPCRNGRPRARRRPGRRRPRGCHWPPDRRPAARTRPAPVAPATRKGTPGGTAANARRHARRPAGRTTGTGPRAPSMPPHRRPPRRRRRSGARPGRGPARFGGCGPQSEVGGQLGPEDPGPDRGDQLLAEGAVELRRPGHQRPSGRSAFRHRMGVSGSHGGPRTGPPFRFLTGFLGNGQPSAGPEGGGGRPAPLDVPWLFLSRAGPAPFPVPFPFLWKAADPRMMSRR
jgi:hypothetical protein